MKKRSTILPLLLAACLLAGCGAPDPSPEAEAVPETKTSAGETAPASPPNPAGETDVSLDGESYSPLAAGLTLTGRGVTAGELSESLARLPEVRFVELRDAEFTASERRTLREEHPEVVFEWPVTILGEKYLSTETELSFAGRPDLDDASLTEIWEAAEEFPGLRTVDLTDCGLDNAALHALDEALGDVDVRWTIELYGVPVCTTDTQIDLSGRKVGDNGAAVEEALPLFSRLEKVVMCDCGVSNEDMDALNRRHENVRFVWMVDVQWAAIRTDALYFTPYAASGVAQTHRRAGLKNLQYCPDLIALDVGHSHTRELGYLEGMPHLKYLIIVENYLTDMEAIGKLKELKWLEMFQCSVRSHDLSPLVNCTSLEDLNICYVTIPGDNVYETLRQMKWLKRIWCSGTRMTRAQLKSLREELPDCEIWCRTGDESTGSTWRYSESYYEMRDAFHMYYMDIRGHRVDRLDEAGLEKMHKKFWKK